MEKNAVEIFISKYEKYYFNGDCGGNELFERRVKKTNSKDEKIIVEMLNKGEHNKEIIAWKFGIYKREKSIDVTKIYAYKNYNMTKYLENINNNKEEIEGCINSSLKGFDNGDYNKAIENLIKVYKILKKEDEERIGGVYIINSIYFLSKGKIPVYDSNVYKAVRALYEKKSPNDIKKIDMPYSKAYSTCVFRLIEYMWLLDQVFGENRNVSSEQYGEIENDGYITRGIDRALWVYGQSKENFFEKCE